MSEGAGACASIVCGVAVLLMVILLPLSFSYVDYWEYGLKQRKSTGRIITNKVYSSGRYFIGPDFKFYKYQADAHIVHLEDVPVFSDGGADSVGLTFLIDVDLTYFIKEDEVGELHKDLASNYKSVVLSRTTDAIKNSATNVSFQAYFDNRKDVEKQLRNAVQVRWDQPPSLHVTLDQFHIGRIHIPDTVAEKQLSAKIQGEKNKEEEFIQAARIEREITALEVNRVNLQKAKLLKEAQANASLIEANAIAVSERVKNGAINTGTKNLLEDLDITSEEHSTAYTYIRTLQNRQNLGLSVSYLADENIVKTSAQAIDAPAP